ncbi:hypothetical protein FBEOM_9226 [Fusarium beomiforme]|uniref:Methyltransferase domain-containing protein n=1 Tax=Fusarium beomiforme TaxID=44412 RepID=A0A9P5ADZ6_9HYPO|nr:hypothetical protein FBEOM_9226 [Fusarium beomiforme]
MAETTSNKGGLTAPPNSPIQGATTPPSCDDIQSSPLTAPIPATWLRERLEDGRPQSRPFAPVPSLCQPVTLEDNNIALSRGNYGRQDDDETRYASVTPNNSPPLNHLRIRFNQNALLACGLFNHWWPSNPFALWDVQYLNQHGVEAYTWYLLAFTKLSTSKQRKRYESNAQWLELRLRDLQAHLQLRDYAVLEAEFSDRQTPEGMTTRAMLGQLQRSQEAALSDFAHWPSEGYDDAVAIFLTKCLARLRFTASLAALQADPARVMATIYWKFERTLQSDGLSSNLLSPCITDQADFSEEYYCKSWLADLLAQLSGGTSAEMRENNVVQLRRNWFPLELGNKGVEDVADQDSSLGDETASSTASLRSSILDYRHENGRTYHRFKDGKYNLPNDERENDRLGLQHHLFLLTFDNRLGLAPPNLPGSMVKRVLDVGTGTGIWAIDFADDHPEAEVLGIDLSPIQPSLYRLSYSLRAKWIFAFMKSEDGTLTEAHALSKWCNLLSEAAVKLGRPYIPTKELKKIMDKVGFTNIVETRFKWPSNCWPKDKKYKELGRWNNENTRLVLESVTFAPLTSGLHWTIEEVNVLADVRKELNDPNIHAYWPICSVYGRKPEV